jgi:hypothetical protein
MLRSRSKGVAKKSQHMLGNAMDFYIPGVPLKKLRDAGLRAAGRRRRLLSVVPARRSSIWMSVACGPGVRPGRRKLPAAIRKGKRFGGGGGGSVVAFASDDSGKSRGLLARLFGGGADEEEDNAEIATPKTTVKPPKAVAKPRSEPEETEVAGPKIKIVPPELATPAEIPAAPEQQPEEIFETPETIIAALPTRKVPTPLFAAPTAAS